MNIKLLTVIPIVLLFTILNVVGSENSIAIIGHKDMVKLSNIQIKKIYTGRIIEVEGTLVTPINIKTPNYLRSLFLMKYLNQDEDKYTAYWTVRRFIGKGTPPKELDSETEMLEFIRNNPGSLGYIGLEKAPEDLIILNK
jgi:ABC-type phosphate transport system substrate-binding protein